MSAAPSPLLPVNEALQRILHAAHGRATREQISVGEGDGRVLADDLVARRTSPPYDISAMDGYAVLAADTASPATALAVIGESAAGRPFSGRVKQGEAARIFTGARIPEGADAVLIQERAEADGATMRPQSNIQPGTFIRRAGSDFALGETLITAGTRLNPGMIALAAAMNYPQLGVLRKPLVALLATGNELVTPGEDAGADGIVASNVVGVAAIIRRAGGEVLDLGIARDTHESIEGAFRAALSGGADCLVTIGGASAGKHDLVRPVAEALGARLNFYRIAMRPGKPLNFGSLGPMLLLGLPGNPVSSLVCATLFLKPLVAALQSDADAGNDHREPALLGAALPANDERQDYLRATLSRDAEHRLIATPFNRQDSALLARYARAEAFIIRPPHAATARSGEACMIIRP